MARSISDVTQALLAELYAPPRWQEQLLGSPRKITLIGQIAATGEYAAATEIASFLLSPDSALSLSAATAVAQLLGSVPPVDLAWLDERARELSPYLGHGRLAWDSLQPDGLARFERFGDASLAVFGLASFHRSGHVREEAVRRLSGFATSDELPFLLIRLNDWVTPVRRLAESAIQARLTPAYARHFVTHLPYVYRLRQAQRAEHEPLISAVEELLGRAECQSALWAGVDSPHRAVQRACFRLALTSAAGESLRLLLDRAFKARDQLTRLWAVDRVTQAFEGEELSGVLERLKRDRYMPIRREALRLTVRYFPENAEAELTAALLDPHTSIREVARIRLGQTGKVDFAAFYREALADAQGVRLVAAVGGLGEVGHADDDRLIIPYLSHTRAKVSRAAIRALSRLNGDAHVGALLRLLQDERAGVSGEAKKALQNRIHLAGTADVWRAFNSIVRRRQRLNALALVAELSKWESIPLLVRAAADRDSEVAHAAQAHAREWLDVYNRQLSRPLAEQVESLTRSLDECGESLLPGVRAELHFLLKSFRR